MAMNRPAHSQTLPAFSAGFRAGLDGKTRSDNPYNAKVMSDAWLKGFDEATKQMASMKK